MSSRMKLFSALIVNRRDIVGYYYRFLVYTDPVDGHHNMKKYGEGVMQVTAETFWKWANELPENLKGSRGLCKKCA